MTKETNKFHALQLFTDTFTAETVHLTNEAIGIYIRLLSFAWTKNTKPFTTESAYRICQCKTDECCINVYEVLKEFFILNTLDKENRNKNTWTQKRLVHEHAYLTDKYHRKSEAGKKGAEARYSANSNIIAPIPSPNPIPNINRNEYHPSFEFLWKGLLIKRGSKFKAYKLFHKNQPNMPKIEEIIRIYNNQTHNVDKKYIPHFATWINERRWEIEEDNNIPDLVDRLKKLGYQYLGNEGNFEKFAKDGKNYKIDIYDDKHQMQLVQ